MSTSTGRSRTNEYQGTYVDDPGLLLIVCLCVNSELQEQKTFTGDRRKVKVSFPQEVELTVHSFYK